MTLPKQTIELLIKLLVLKDQLKLLQKNLHDLDSGRTGNIEIKLITGEVIKVFSDYVDDDDLYDIINSFDLGEQSSINLFQFMIAIK